MSQFLAALDSGTLILIGDPNQLPAIVKSAFAKAMGADVPVMERVVDYFARRAGARVDLNVRCRMPPALAAFPLGSFFKETLADFFLARSFVSADARPGEEKANG